MYRKRFWKREIFDSVAKLIAVLNEVYEDKVNITEASLRWLYHHSKLDGLFGDGVILGASSMEYFDFNLGCSAKGPLDERVVRTLMNAGILAVLIVLITCDEHLSLDFYKYFHITMNSIYS